MNKVQRLLTGASFLPLPTEKPFQGLFGHSLNLVVIDFIVRHMGWSTICIADIPLPYPVAKRTLHEIAEHHMPGEKGMLLEEARTGGDPVYHPNQCSERLYALYLLHCAIRDDQTGSDLLNHVLSYRFYLLPSAGFRLPEPGAC